MTDDILQAISTRDKLNSKDSVPAPAYIMDDETKITDPTEIAEFFNNIFINMVTKYIKK